MASRSLPVSIDVTESEFQPMDTISEASTMEVFPARPCVLCAYHGNTSIVTRKIVTYLEEAISNVHKDEICVQVVEELAHHDMHMTVQEVEIHINQHMINKQVIMSNIVYDLLDIARASKQSCLLTSEETGHPAVDPKYASIYFKAVDQLGNILRSDAFKANKSTT